MSKVYMTSKEKPFVEWTSIIHNISEIVTTTEEISMDPFVSGTYFYEYLIWPYISQLLKKYMQSGIKFIFIPYKQHVF